MLLLVSHELCAGQGCSAVPPATSGLVSVLSQISQSHTPQQPLSHDPPPLFVAVADTTENTMPSPPSTPAAAPTLLRATQPSRSEQRKPYLVAMTTCNQWRLTSAAISNLASLTDPIDVVIVDDNSEDGTAALARARGVRVIEVRVAAERNCRGVGGCPRLTPFDQAISHC